MVKFQFSKQKTKSAEKISQQVFYIMIGLAVLVFGLFFLVGYDLPFEENPDFNAPLFTDVLITIHEGRNRQIRRMVEALGHQVIRLKRVKYGPIELGTLARGEWRDLSAQEVSDLRRSAGLSD